MWALSTLLKRNWKLVDHWNTAQTSVDKKQRAQNLCTSKSKSMFMLPPWIAMYSKKIKAIPESLKLLKPKVWGSSPSLCLSYSMMSENRTWIEREVCYIIFTGQLTCNVQKTSLNWRWNKVTVYTKNSFCEELLTTQTGMLWTRSQ